MLSRESYKILKDLPQELPVECVQPIHKELLNRGYLTEGWNLSVGSYCRITEIGRAAVEEYERENRSEQRDVKSLAGTTWANIISALALAVSIAALIVSLRG